MLDAELHPNLVYRIDGDQARFATWRTNQGHEALAIFTTPEAAAKYLAELADSAGWTAYQPPREKLIDVLRRCRGGNSLRGALDPLGGNAKTLFDIPQVLRTAEAGK